MTEPVPAAEYVPAVDCRERAEVCRRQARQLREQADRMDKLAEEWELAAAQDDGEA